MLAHKNHILTISFCVLILFSSGAAGQTITTPLEEFGFNLGDDYQLANYTQLETYWRKLEKESERIKLEIIGNTAEGRSIYMAIITSPDNHSNLSRYKEISKRLALAEGVSEEDARQFSREGKSIVWIDGGLHATEVLGAQQLMELVYQLVSQTDDETMRFLRDTIVLATCVNPDGLELVANWYMRNPVVEDRSTSGLPRLYQKYVGHDNNRDFYMSSQPESKAVNQILYKDWFPQIVYNHHQTGPRGTVLFAPPFRDPFNYNFDPLIVTSLDQVAGAMHSRFLAEGKPGATMRSGATYSTWWNGGLRTSPYFHNMIGLLTETIGSPTPMKIPFVIDKQLPKGDYPSPIAPQIWHFRDSIEYSITANRAVLDFASRNRDTLLFNIWRMGMNSINRGNRDTWTITPDRVSHVKGEMAADGIQSGVGSAGPIVDRYFSMMQDPAMRDPRGYIITADQPDFLTATKFVNILIQNGVVVHRARDAFHVAGNTYPSGSYIVKTGQAFRPHVLDMFEPQDYPDDFAYPGAPPTPPYDTTGWTLAYQMGVQFDRVLDEFDGLFDEIDGFVSPPSGSITRLDEISGFFLTHSVNDAFIAVNRLLGDEEDVYWLRQALILNGKTYPPGTMYIPAKADTAEKLALIASEVGLIFEATAIAPDSDALLLRSVRIGLWDRYGGSMPSGWTRFMLEKFEFPYEVVYPKALDQENLSERFDVLIFVDGGIPSKDSGEDMRVPVLLPAEYEDSLGVVTVSKTVPRIKRFLEDGGTVLVIGGSTVLAEHLGLPISDALVETLEDGRDVPLRREKFYVPGSVLRVQVDNANPLAFGLDSEVDIFFRRSPAFRLDSSVPDGRIQAVAWFGRHLLRSGWAWGENYLEDTIAVIDASVGMGKLFIFGPEIAFRAQPHGTFKFLFNGIYYGPSEPVSLGEVQRIQ